MSEFERFLSNLQAMLDSRRQPEETVRTQVPPSGDAIDRELIRQPRTTTAVSLKDAPEVEAFRNELMDGLIRVDTANQLLRLANAVISRLLV